ncbi:hypothetical protein L6452_25423 [Arctium lappa]|uniref:Uncharacterized protein n=1 Tax=Arctium lappa TaxID=4217 RepID=A0ACB9ACA9_ARCLA|nr:hypothetical protein L6452_25423 [Arctium lappa]
MKSRSHRLPTISDTPDDWVDESWTVDCVCGVNFDDGEEMVDCDECGVWVHTRCSRYVKSEKLFACDKCKSKKLRKESEETEVAQLLAELPTKTLRMDSPYPMSCPPQNPLQVWTEIPLQEKVHVQGIPGGDPALFGGVSSVFSPELWKCTGYVPKKFNFQYREFPCWDERQDDGNKGKEEMENRASKGADALFSLSKENALPAQVATFSGMKTPDNGGCDMGPPTTDKKKQEVENYEGRRQHGGVRRERSLPKPIVIHSSNQKKDDSRLFKDLNRKKNGKAMDKEGVSRKRDLHFFESVSTTSSDAKQSEPYEEGKGPKVFKTDKQSSKHENSRADVQANHKSDGCLDMFNTNNNPSSSGQPSENVPFDDSRLNPSKEAKQMEENDGNQVPPSVEISPQTEDGMASSLKHNPMETITMKDEVGQDVVDDVNDNGTSCSRSNGNRSNTNDLEKVDLPPKSELHASPLRSIEEKAVETNRPGKTSNSEIFHSDVKLDSSKTVSQLARISNDPLSASSEVKKETVSVSQIHKVQNVDKSLPHVDGQVDELDEPLCGPSQPKGMKGSENSTVARGSSEFKHAPGPPEVPSKSHGTVRSPSGAPNQCKVTVSTVVKSSVGKPSSKPSVPDKARYSNTDDRNSSGKQKGACDNNSKGRKDNAIESPRIGDASEKPKKSVKDLPKSLSTSALKSSHLSKSSHAPVSKKNSSDSKDPAIVSSSKNSSVQIAATPDSGDSTNSLRSENGALEQNKSTSELSVRGEKINQLNRQLAPKNNPPHVHPPPSTNPPATLSDEELALLLHQELNSSPRVPRVPRMRHAGSLPQLASTTPTSTLMKRTLSSGGKDNGLVSRKKNKDLANNGPSNSREVDGSKKVDRLSSLPNSRRHDLVKNGSAKAMHHVDKSAPPASTTVSSGPSSSNEANEHNMSSTRTSPQNASDDETGAIGVPTHRTLPGLIAEIMSKGKRMAYEELCNAVLPHWPNLRKHNGERYAYSSHSQAVLDCLRNRSEWSRLVDRGPKTNAGRKRRKSEADAQNLESEEDDYSTDRNTKDVDSKSLESQRSGKQKARKHRRLALQGRGIKDVRRRRKAEVLSDDIDSSSDSSEESAFSDEGETNEASASSDEMGTMS